MTQCFNLSDSRCPGKVIIFNHYKYKNDDIPKRGGTEEDVGNLSKEFGKLSFEATTYQNNTKKEVCDKLEKHAEKNYSDYGCLVVIVLTHGEENGALHAYDEVFNTSDVWNPFVNCETLQDKPKIFIFQACRGPVEEKRWVRTDANPENCDVLRKKDFLFVYSTAEGQAAHRTSDGSWYVQALTKQLHRLGRNVDLLSLLTHVNYHVIKDYGVDIDASKKLLPSKSGKFGQTPNFISTLTKPVTLSGNISIVSEYEYAMWHEDRGYALILHDATHDTTTLREALGSLNFKVIPKVVESKEDVERIVKENAVKVEKGKCFFIALMCNIKDELVVVGTNKMHFSQVPQLLQYSKFQNLAGIPKLIFYLDQQSTTVARDGGQTVQSNMMTAATEHSDFLVVRAYTKEKSDSILESLSTSHNNDLVTKLTTCVGNDVVLESSLQSLIVFRNKTPEEVKEKLLATYSEFQKTSIRPCCEDFMGRTSEYKKLQQLHLKQDNYSDGIDVLVHGPPGVGKTELVYKFLEISKIQHSSVMWIHAASQEFIAASIKAEVEKFNIPTNEDLHLLTSVYSKHKGMIKPVLVFDEALSQVQLVDILPNQEYINHMFIIVTSNDSTIEARNKISLQRFSDTETKRFVKQSIVDAKFVSKVCTDLKSNHGNVPAILGNLCKSFITDQVLKDNINNLDGTSNKDIFDRFAFQNTSIATDKGYNKQIDKMYDIPIKQLDSLDDRNFAIDVLQRISVIDHDQIPHSLFPQPILKKGYKLLNELSIVQLTSDFIESNSILRQKIRKMYKPELQVITNKVIQQYKCQGPEDTKIFYNPLFVKSAIKSWNMIVQYPESISEAASIGIAILKQKGETIENKNKFVTTFGQQIKQNLSTITNQKKEDLLTLCLKCALVCYKNGNYENCIGYIESLLNLTSSSPILTRAKALQIFVNAKTTKNKVHMKEFVNLFQEKIKASQHLLQLAKACRDASFLFAEENRVENYGRCWQELIQASSNKNDQDLVIKQILKCIEILFQHKNYAYTRDLCSKVSDQNWTSCTNGVLILNYKACCLYHLAKQSTEGKSKQLNLAFATWKDLYDNHYTSQLDLHFDDMLDCAKLLDNNKVGPNLDWVFSKIKTEQRDGLVKVLQMLRETRENEKLSKEDALRMSQRISLPQHLREPARDWFENIATRGSVEYISGLEIEHGNNALGWMEHHISLEAVTYLVQNGADVRATGGDSDSTILHEAALRGVLDVVVYAVQHKADVNVGDKYGETALHKAAWTGRIELVKYLISQGAVVSVTDKNGGTALHHAALSGRIEVVKYLISQGADLNVTDNKGCTALHKAAWGGHIEVVKYLISQGADLNVTDDDGCTALHKAAWGGHIEVVKYLMSHGAEVSVTGNDGRTALHWAALIGLLDVVRHLVTSGADHNIKDIQGRTALDWARYYNKPAVAKYLKSLNTKKL